MMKNHVILLCTFFFKMVIYHRNTFYSSAWVSVFNSFIRTFSISFLCLKLWCRVFCLLRINHRHSAHISLLFFPMENINGMKFFYWIWNVSMAFRSCVFDKASKFSLPTKGRQKEPQARWYMICELRVLIRWSTYRVIRKE